MWKRFLAHTVCGVIALAGISGGRAAWGEGAPIMGTGAERLAEAERLMTEARDLLAESDPARVAALTLRESLFFALHHNLDVAVQGFEPEAADADVLTEEGAFDPELFGTYTQTQRSDPQTTRGALATGGAASIDEEQVTLDGGVRGTIATGAEYELSGARTRTASSLNSAAGIGSEFDVESTARITQPFLRNFGIAVNTAPIRIAQRQRSIAEAEFARQVMQTLTEVHDAYWEVVRTRENLRVAIDSLHVAGDLLRQNQIRLDVGTMAPLEVLQAETGVAAREETLIVARQAVQDASDALLRLMNLPKTLAAWDHLVLPKDAPAGEAPTHDMGAAVTEALRMRPELEAAQLEQENAAINLMVARNQMLPDVSGTAEYGVTGINKDLDKAFDQAGRTHTENWLLQADARYPVLNRAARGAHRRAEVEHAQQALRVTSLELQVTTEVRAAARAVETGWKRIAVTELARRLAAEQLAAEQKKLEVGVSTSFDVLEKEQDLSEAKSNEIAARINYHLAHAALDLATGQTLATHNVTIDAVRE